MANYYVDTNETIYAYESLKSLGVAQTASATVTLGLEDLTDLSGTSKININRIHFGCTGYLDAVTIPNTVGSFFALGGIAPSGFSVANPLGSASDYQDVEGWPLKGVMRYGVARAVDPLMNNNMASASFSKTYVPSRKGSSKGLTLNRGQEIVFNVKSVYEEWDYYMFIVLECRRGD